MLIAVVVLGMAAAVYAATRPEPPRLVYPTVIPYQLPYAGSAPTGPTPTPPPAAGG